jgi:hypothetical protein
MRGLLATTLTFRLQCQRVLQYCAARFTAASGAALPATTVANVSTTV